MRSLIYFLDYVLGTILTTVLILVFLPLLVILFLPMIVYTYWIANQYRFVARELKRVEALAKSPVFILFNETLNGLAIIRSFQSQQEFFVKLFDRIDDMNCSHIYLWRCTYWLNFRMQILSAIVAGSVGSMVVYFANRQILITGLALSLTPSAAAIMLLYSANLFTTLMWLIRSMTEVI